MYFAIFLTLILYIKFNGVLVDIYKCKAYNSHPMNLIKHNRGFKQRFIALLACASVLFSAIAPTISHAVMSQSTPSGMMKVCTSTGNKFIPVSFIIAKASTNITESTPATNTRSNKADKMSSCGYCDQHAGSTGFISYTQLALSEVTTAVRLSTAFYLNPRSHFSSSPTSPRGPPSVSV